MLLLSYLDKIGLSLTAEAGQALAFLYSEARLYKGPRLVMSNQRFFKIVCFRFPTNVPKKIEYIHF